MKDMFEKFLGNKMNSIGNLGVSIEKKNFIYCIIQLKTDDLHDSIKEKYLPLIEDIFKFAEETNGDVNQFCCGTILVLYGVPVNFGNKYENVRQFLLQIINKRDNIKVIVGEDIGAYGSFGYEKRLVCTAVSQKLIEDFERLIKTSDKRIMVNKSIIEKIGNMNNIEVIE